MELAKYIVNFKMQNGSLTVTAATFGPFDNYDEAKEFSEKYKSNREFVEISFLHKPSLMHKIKKANSDFENICG
jgi:hypothetical protein